MPAAETSTSRSTRVGKASASSAPTNPPIELPTTATRSTPSASHIASTVLAYPWIEIGSAGMSEPPKPGRSSARQRWVSLKAGMFSSQLCQFELQPWMKSSGVPPPATGPVSSTLTRRPEQLVRPLQRAPVDVHPGRVVAVRIRLVGPGRGARCAPPRRVVRVVTPRLTTVSTACHEDRHRHRLDPARLLGAVRGAPSAAASASRCPTRTRSRGRSRCCAPSRCAPP